MSLSHFQDILEGKIDFHGQRKTDDIIRITLIASTILSFVIGFALQSLSVTMGTFALSTVVLALVVLPPWPMYNKNPVKWLPPQPQQTSSKSK